MPNDPEDPYTRENVKKLEMVQRRAAWYVLNQYNRTCNGFQRPFDE